MYLLVAELKNDLFCSFWLYFILLITRLTVCAISELIVMLSFQHFPQVTLICDPSGRNQSHVGRVRFPLRAKMHGRAHITDSCFIAFITSKIC